MVQRIRAEPASVRAVVADLIVAGAVGALGALVIYESRRLGASWGSDGPQAGYFPFYVGLLICICSTVVFVQSLFRLRTEKKIFVAWAPFKQVLVVLVPATLYVLGIQLIGIYVASAAFITLFMKFVGKYSWRRGIGIGLFVSIAAFLMFEILFRIPLPKGPLEALLGY